MIIKYKSIKESLKNKYLTLQNASPSYLKPLIDHSANRNLFLIKLAQNWLSNKILELDVIHSCCHVANVNQYACIQTGSQKNTEDVVFYVTEDMKYLHVTFTIRKVTYYRYLIEMEDWGFCITLAINLQHVNACNTNMRLSIHEVTSNHEFFSEGVFIIQKWKTFMCK